MSTKLDAYFSRNTLRPYLLLTLIHAECRIQDKGLIISRIVDLFCCKSVVLSTERHEDGKGLHYHVGIWATNASKNTLKKQLRSTFPEWDGRSLNVSMHKGWGSICEYVLKEDQTPLVWGEFTLEQLKDIAKARARHKESRAGPTSQVLLKKLEDAEDWFQVYRDEVLREKLLTYLPRMKEAFEDLKILKDIETTVLERLVDYLSSKGFPEEYDVEYLKEKYLLIDWLACQLVFKRPIKTKQLFVYGAPSTQKTLLLNFLGKAVRIYFASSRRNDFAGANDYYDLWVFDEFHEHSEYNSYTGSTVGSTTEGSSYVNTLLKVLDGQECRLDSKYSKVFKKKRNVPIIMVANSLPQLMSHHGPFRARFFRLRFSSQIPSLEEERVLATLYGCMLRRILNSPYSSGIRTPETLKTPEEVKLTYNKESGLAFPLDSLSSVSSPLFTIFSDWVSSFSYVKVCCSTGDFKSARFFLSSLGVFLTSTGSLYLLKPILREPHHLSSVIFELHKFFGSGLEVLPNSSFNCSVGLLDFSSIPLKKLCESSPSPSSTFFDCLFGEESEASPLSSEVSSSPLNTVKVLFLDSVEKRSMFNAFSFFSFCSNFNVERSSCEDSLDFALWPLEIRFFMPNGDSKLFPLLVRSNSQDFFSEVSSCCECLRFLSPDKLRELRSLGLKCEISLSKNSEKVPWDLDS